MTKIHETRNKIDKKLDKLEAMANALGSHLHETRESAVSRIEAQKQAYLDMLHKLKEYLGKSKDVTAEAKQEIITAIDQAKVQLALGKADTRDAIGKQKKKINLAVSELEAKVDLKFEHVSDKMVEKMIVAGDKLDAELHAAAIRIETEKSVLNETLSEKKQELESKIDAFRTDIAEKRQAASEKWALFEEDLNAGLKTVTHAFKQLFT